MLHFLVTRAEQYSIAIACYFEMINEGGIDVAEKEARLTPIGRAFALASAHAGAKKLACGEHYTHVVSENNGLITATFLNDSFDAEKRFVVAEEMTIHSSVLYRSDSVLPYERFTPADLPFVRQDECIEWILPPHSMALVRGSRAADKKSDENA